MKLKTLAMVLGLSLITSDTAVEPVKVESIEQVVPEPPKIVDSAPDFSPVVEFNKDSPTAYKYHLIRQYVDNCEGWKYKERWAELGAAIDDIEEHIKAVYAQKGLREASMLIDDVQSAIDDSGCEGYNFTYSLPPRARWDKSVNDALRSCDEDPDCYDIGKYLSESTIQDQTDEYRAELITKYCGDKGYMFNEIPTVEDDVIVFKEHRRSKSFPFCHKMFWFTPDVFADSVDYADNGMLGIAYEFAGVIADVMAFGEFRGDIFERTKEVVCAQRDPNFAMMFIDELSIKIFDSRLMEMESEHRKGNYSLSRGHIFPDGVYRVSTHSSPEDKHLKYKGKTLIEFVDGCK